MYEKQCNTIEYEFRLKHGCYPYTYLERQLENGLSFNKAIEKLQDNINSVWLDMQINYQRNSVDLYDEL